MTNGLKGKKVLMIAVACAMVLALSACSSFESNESDGASPSSGGEAKVVRQVDLEEIPQWSGEPSVELNNNEPQFTDLEIKEDDYEKLSAFDKEGRSGQAIACISEESMPEGERGSIGMIKPSGWRIKKYDFIDGQYLYNRCHLIGWQLTGDNDEKNLITGTRYMNTEGMLPYENEVASYIRETGNHVMYKVTPVYEGDEPIARGVHMQAMSLEDDGEGVAFNVFCYNVQPAVNIDYETGQSELGDKDELKLAGQESEGDFQSTDGDSNEQQVTNRSIGGDSSESEENHYILNSNTMRFHYQWCNSVSQMKDKNKKEFNGTRQEAIDSGYKPCGNCNP